MQKLITIYLPKWEGGYIIEEQLDSYLQNGWRIQNISGCSNGEGSYVIVLLEALEE